MDTRRVRNFLAVVDAGSIARAAVTLHIAQPALSAQMRQLEEFAGCALLVRSARGVSPTAMGLEFCRKGAELLSLADQLQHLGRDMAKVPEGPITIGLPTSVANMLSMPLVETVVERFPRVQLGLLESTSADLGEQLLQGRIDLAVLFADNLTSGMRHDALLEEDLFVVSASRMPDEVALSTLHDLPLVMPARPNSVRLLLDKACSQRGVMPRILAEISSPYTMLQLARAGRGATVLPWSMLAHADLRGLWAARILSPRLTRTLCVAADAQVVESSRLQAIREVVSELLRSLVTRSEWRGARIKRRAVRTSG